MPLKLVFLTVFDIGICEFYTKSMLELMGKINTLNSD